MYTKYLNLLFTWDSFLTYLKKEGSRAPDFRVYYLLFYWFPADSNNFYLIFPKSIFIPTKKRLPGEMKSIFCGITTLNTSSRPIDIRSHLYS